MPGTLQTSTPDPGRSRTRAAARVAITTLLVATTSCFAQTLSDPCSWETFKELPHREKTTSLQACGAEEQVDLYLKWSFSTRPPNTDLAESVALSGKKVLEAIVARVERDGSFDENGVKPELIHLLFLMQVRGHYAAADDVEVMRRLARAVERIADDVFREFATSELENLRNARFRSRAR
jgi:hypothetical protein